MTSLSAYVKVHLEKGHTPRQIHDHLVAHGYPRKDVVSALRKARGGRLSLLFLVLIFALATDLVVLAWLAL